MSSEEIGLYFLDVDSWHLFGHTLTFLWLMMVSMVEKFRDDTIPQDFHRV